MGHFWDSEKNYPYPGKPRYVSGYETIQETEKKINVSGMEVIFKLEISRRYNIDTHTNTKEYTTPEGNTITVSIPSLSITKRLMPGEKRGYTVIADPKYQNEEILIEILHSMEIPEKIHPSWGHSIFTFNSNNKYIQF